jgi:protein involved in polysaccharide export with SLBB domain
MRNALMNKSLFSLVLFVCCFVSVKAIAVGYDLDDSSIEQLQMMQRLNPDMDLSHFNNSQQQYSLDKNGKIQQLNPVEFTNENNFKDKKEEASRLETDYESRIKDTMFGAEDIGIYSPKQFGYNVLSSTGKETNVDAKPLIGAIYDNYIMGAGDSVVMTLRGQESLTNKVEVDKEGRIIFPDLSPVVAMGRPFGDVRRELEEVVKEKYVKTIAYISLGELKLSSVLIAGEVEKPGITTISGLSSVVDALFAVGGVKKSGSLRNIKIIRGEKTINVDLYSVLLANDNIKSYSILDGDKIVVPAIGKTIAIVGDVKRPGIYELSDSDKKEISIKDIKEYAAGVLRKRDYRYTKISSNSEGYDVVSQIDKKKKFKLANSDIIIVAGKHNASKDNVLLTGHVSVPGLRSLKEFRTVRSIVKNIDIFKENPYLLLGVLQRKNPVTLARDYIPLNISAIIQEEDADIALKGGDRLIILGNEDIRYLSSYEVQMALSKRNLGDDENSNGYEEQIEELMQARAVSSSGSAVSDDDLFMAMAKQNAEEKKQKEEANSCKGLKELFLLVSNSPKGRFSWARLSSEDLKELKKAKLENMCPIIYDRYPDLLPFLLDYAVVVDGEIRSPGIYPVLEGADLASILSAAGGFFRTADLTNIEVSNFSKLSNMKISRESEDIDSGLGFRKIINANEIPLAAVELSPGDAVRFNSMFSQRDDGGVLLAGEFIHPGTYQIKRGERLSDVIKRAGGITDQAYPIGAIFTRESIKKTEQNMVKLALKDMQSNFLHAISNQEVEPGTVEAIMRPLRNVASIEIGLGRMVVEADPAVLQVRPNLDTVLQPGDKIYIPKRSNHVMVIGEVLSPGAMQFVSGTDPKDYIMMAGGMKDSADDDKVFVVMPNGMARNISVSSWKFGSLDIPPGSAIFVPRNVAPFNFMVFMQDSLDIVSKAAITAASIISINNE